MHLILQSFYFMLPAIVANSSPVILAKFNIFESLKKPLNQKLFGENKTWRGIIFGIVLGVFTATLQFKFFSKDISIFNYENAGILISLLLGFLQSTGILGFDLLKSFFKRKLNKAPGSPWPPFDELDFLGGLLLSFILIIPPFSHILIIIFGAPIFHSIFNLLGYIFHLKKVWY